jgi:hypothetical protein
MVRGCPHLECLAQRSESRRPRPRPAPVSSDGFNESDLLQPAYQKVLERNPGGGVGYFSDAVVRNPIAGQGSEDPELDEWSRNDLGRLPGLKFMRTLWVCDIAGGPQVYAATKPGKTNLGLEEAHRALEISPDIFDEVAAELARSLDHFNVPEREKGEVLAAFAAHKGEVVEG